MPGLSSPARGSRSKTNLVPALIAVLVALASAVATPSSATTAAAAVATPSSATPAAAAADVTFEQPTATATLGQSVSFRVGFSSPTAPTSVELLRHGPRDEAEFVSVATVADAGSGRYTATVDDRGHVLPNTTFLYRFRVTTPDGVAIGEEHRFTVTDERFDWRVREGALIRLHWYEGDDAFADRALKVGDDGLAKATTLLGVTETEPVDFFIYAEESAFRDAMGPGTRENVGGRAVPDIRTLFALIRPSEIGSDWIDNVIPHELTHLVFGTASDNPYHFPPKWLNEGLAVYLEPGGYSADWRARVELAGRSGSLIPLDGLALQFPADQAGFFLGYAESVSAVDFFIRRYGQDTIVKLIRSYAAGVSDDDAFRAATGADVKAFNDAWIAEMGARPAAAAGPQPAPPGPLPTDWSAPSETPQPSITPSPTSPPASPSSTTPPPTPAPTGSPGASASGPAASIVTPSPPSGALAPSPSPAPGGPSGERDGSGVAVMSAAIAILGALLLLGGLYLVRRRPPDQPYPPAR